jgi:hypothetical protein
MKRASWLVIPILFAFGCTRPEVEAFRRNPAPVAVTVTLPTGLPDRDGFQQEYASALRARLATRVVVVPGGVMPPAGAANLQVDIRGIAMSGGNNAAAVGLATGVAVGTLSAVSGNRGWGLVDGLFWGLFVGSNVAAHQDYVRNRLGYWPQAVKAEVRLMQAGNPEPLWVETIEPREVIDAMDPLPRGYRDDGGRIREEEAKGFARVVVQKLAMYFQWTRFTEQRFYGVAPGYQEPASPSTPATPPPMAPPPPPPADLPPPPPTAPPPPVEPK